MDLEKDVQNNLRQMGSRPLLLGFSGGEDSLALAHCLIRLKLSFHIAHFDHAWRASSGSEAEEFKNWAEKQGIPFYMERSEGKVAKEDEAREERYAFFQRIFGGGDFAALVLAHHQGDQLETTLKRIFEGAPLPLLRGMKPTHQRGEMPIWRPLLSTSKETIRSYIQEHGLTPIDDPTNRDPKYLRARMREELIPLLNEKFGKKMGPSILRLGSYSAELEEYLELQTAQIQPVESSEQITWDFSSAHPIEIRFVLGKFFRKNRLVATEPVYDQILNAIFLRKSKIKICFGGRLLIADRGRLTFNYNI